MRALIVLIAAAAAWAQDFPTVRLHTVARGLRQPLDIKASPDGTGRLFVVEHAGRIRVIRDGALLTQPFLDIVDRVLARGEQGLLGMAFPPGFAQKQYFYVNYTDRQGTTIISRFRVTADANRADPASEKVILTIAQPFANHNGGNLLFNPRDGFLYIGMGDGGSSNDPENNGQRTDTLLGKMLRIDTEGGSDTYTSPSSNPFSGRTGYRPEIWATGLRNPWRYSFDRETGDLWIADVGQNRAEEVNFQPASSTGGENYGWRPMEGLQCNVRISSTCDRNAYTLPILEYTRERGDVSVTGGYVYRGKRYAALTGIYLYADYATGRMWGVRRAGDRWENRELAATGTLISSFGEDEGGELYVADFRGGTVSLITAGPPTFTAETVLNVASSGIAAGSLATIYGFGLTSFNGIVQANSFPLPTELAGTSVRINGTAVPLLAVADVNGQEQINFQVPYGLSGRVTITVTANGQTSAPIEVNLVEAQPEIFTITRQGSMITVWATGLGPVDNAPETGRPAPSSPLAPLRAPVEVNVAGSQARVIFAGLAPGFAGLYQINAEIRPDTASQAPVTVRVGSAVSREGRLP